MATTKMGRGEKTVGWVGEVTKRGLETRQIERGTRKQAVAAVRREIERMEHTPGWQVGVNMAGRVGKIVRGPFGQRIIYSGIPGVPSSYEHIRPVGR